jgi:hypothetical protein
LVWYGWRQLLDQRQLLGWRWLLALTFHTDSWHWLTNWRQHVLLV